MGERRDLKRIIPQFFWLAQPAVAGVATGFFACGSKEGLFFSFGFSAMPKTRTNLYMTYEADSLQIGLYSFRRA